MSTREYPNMKPGSDGAPWFVFRPPEGGVILVKFDADACIGCGKRREWLGEHVERLEWRFTCLSCGTTMIGATVERGADPFRAARARYRRDVYLGTPEMRAKFHVAVPTASP